MRNTQRQENGITLIALVITIIVLLILAGVTIAMLTGQNSILNRSTEAVWENDLAEGKDQVAIAWNAAYSEYLSKYYTNKLAEGETLVKIFKTEFDKIKNGGKYTATLDNETTPTKVIVTSNSDKNQSVATKIKITTTEGAVEKGSLGSWAKPITGINYGTGKTEETIDVGDDLTISGKSFRVLKTDKKTQIIAVPHNNITLDTNNPTQSASAGTTKFTAQQTDKYWDTGEDNIDWTNDKCLLKPYVKAYSDKLDAATGNTGRVSARLGRLSEFSDAAIKLPTGSSLTKNQVKNPGQTGKFWIGSGSPSNAECVYYVNSAGGFGNNDFVTYYYGTFSYGVRPVIVIDI